MNTYKYSDMFVGLEECFYVKITDEMMERFFKITQDKNPLHCDQAFAQEHGYSDKVVYGMLTSSMLSTLAGVYLPGRNSLIHEVQTKFVKPVYVDDTLCISGKVVELNNSVERIVIKVTVFNQKQEKVLRGIMKVGFIHETK